MQIPPVKLFMLSQKLDTYYETYIMFGFAFEYLFKYVSCIICVNLYADS